MSSASACLSTCSVCSNTSSSASNLLAKNPALPRRRAHIGAGTPFASRLNALLADLAGPGGERWKADALARALIEQGVPVRPEFVAALCSGTRARPDRFVVAAVAGILGVPVSYFDGRAVRLSTDAATGRQVVVEELRNSAGQPNPRLLPAL